MAPSNSRRRTDRYAAVSAPSSSMPLAPLANVPSIVAPAPTRNGPLTSTPQHRSRWPHLATRQRRAAHPAYEIERVSKPPRPPISARPMRGKSRPRHRRALARRRRRARRRDPAPRTEPRSRRQDRSAPDQRRRPPSPPTLAAAYTPQLRRRDGAVGRRQSPAHRHPARAVRLFSSRRARAISRAAPLARRPLPSAGLRGAAAEGCEPHQPAESRRAIPPPPRARTAHRCDPRQRGRFHATLSRRRAALLRPRQSTRRGPPLPPLRIPAAGQRHQTRHDPARARAVFIGDRRPRQRGRELSIQFIVSTIATPSRHRAEEAHNTLLNASLSPPRLGVSCRPIPLGRRGAVKRIGHYHLANNDILAPMAGVTDRPYRQLCKDLGAGMAVSEMVSANSLLWNSVKTQQRINHVGEMEPRSVQIAGADPATMAEAARYNADHGAQIIDINMGCPAKKVCNVMAGSALLQNEALVARILEAVVQAVDVPVPLKIRTGWDPDHRNGVAIARIAEQSGIQALAVHGRTRACGYRGEAEYDTLAAIKASIKIPVIANGDITSPQKAKYVLERTGADAVMIGRAAQGAPWLFRIIHHYLTHNEVLPAPPLGDIRRILVHHLQRLHEFFGEHMGVLVARKHIAWYSKGQPGGAEFRQLINQAATADAQLHYIDRFFDELEQQPAIAA